MEAQGVTSPARRFTQRQRRQVDQRASGADVGIAADAEHPARAGNRCLEHQPIDAKARNGEIEIGEERRTGRWQQLWQAEQPELGGGQPPGGEGLCRQVEGAPVEVDARNFRKNALRIGQFEAMNGGHAENRPVDTIGRDRQADLHLDARQLLDEKGTAIVAVDPAHRPINQRRRQHDDDPDQGEHAADAPAEAVPDRKPRTCCRIGHGQNAWPMET